MRTLLLLLGICLATGTDCLFFKVNADGEEEVERKNSIYLCGKRRSSAMFTVTEIVVQQEGESV